MDVLNFIFSAENLRTLFLFVAMMAGFFWFDKRVDQKISASEARTRQDINGLGAALRKEMDERFAAFHKMLKEVDFPQLAESIKAQVRVDMDERFAAFHKMLKEVDFPQLAESIKAQVRVEMDERLTAFHKMLKENDFAHLNETIKALTFTLQKNKILEPEDKRFVDSHLDGG